MAKNWEKIEKFEVGKVRILSTSNPAGLPGKIPEKIAKLGKKKEKEFEMNEFQINPYIFNFNHAPKP